MTTLIKKMKAEMELRGFSASTKYVYLRMVTALYEYYNKRSLSKLSDKQIKHYLLKLISKKKIAPATYNLNIQSLKFFYEVVLRQPISKYTLPRMREPKKFPDILSSFEVEKLIKSAESIKARTIFIVAYGSGLRLSEIASLTISDIDSKRMVIHVRKGKRSKDRYALLSPVMLKVLRNYWCKYRSKIHCREKWLFPGTNSKKHVSARTITYYFHAAKKRANITKAVTFHSFRHSFATHTLESGGNLFQVKELLGHASIKSTVPYLHMTEKKLGILKSPIDNINI
jgi:site-specific recombinase XerD